MSAEMIGALPCHMVPEEHMVYMQRDRGGANEAKTKDSKSQTIAKLG